MSEISSERVAKYERRGAHSSDVPFYVVRTQLSKDVSLYNIDPDETPNPKALEMVLAVDNHSSNISKLTLQGPERLDQPRILAMLAQSAFYGIQFGERPSLVVAVASSEAEEELYRDTIGVDLVASTSEKGSQSLLAATPQEIVAYTASILTDDGDYYHVPSLRPRK